MAFVWTRPKALALNAAPVADVLTMPQGRESSATGSNRPPFIRAVISICTDDACAGEGMLSRRDSTNSKTYLVYFVGYIALPARPLGQR